MKLKTFKAATMAEALAQVKREFGPSAVILNTRTASRGKVLGLRAGDIVEITAARDMSDLPPALTRGTLKTGRVVEAEGAAARVSPSASHPDRIPTGPILTELGELKSLVSGLVRDAQRSRRADMPEQLFDTYRKLVENQVAEQMAGTLVERVRKTLGDARLADSRAVTAELVKALEAMLPTAGPVKTAPGVGPTVVALIGPTGVGKTTTIAKLAANFCLRERRRVGLITVDTYRIAAVQQLRTYAQIIDVPLEVANSPRQLESAVGRMEDRDIILIDTAGRSQRDTVKIRELHEFFRAVRPHEVHLVLSGTCGEAILTETIERFSEIGIDRVIFTKLDEAVGLGVLLTCLEKAGAALSYVTTGQDVPDDIEVGHGAGLAKLVLGAPCGA